MAIVDLVNVNQYTSVFDFDEIACMMIAEAWSLLDKYPHLKTNNESLVECIEFLIKESEDNMEQNYVGLFQNPRCLVLSRTIR